MEFSRWVFNIAGVYGVISLAPLYFMEQAIDRQDPPPITHPMFFYGFVGVTLAWQLLFFAIAYQPVRLRPVIPFAVIEKLSLRRTIHSRYESSTDECVGDFVYVENKHLSRHERLAVVHGHASLFDLFGCDSLF
jgi:hypothetical protein